MPLYDAFHLLFLDRLYFLMHILLHHLLLGRSRPFRLRLAPRFRSHRHRSLYRAQPRHLPCAGIQEFT
jgi:hypothetical protein